MSNNAEKEFLKDVRPLAESLRDYAMNEGKQYGITDFRIVIAANDKQANSVEKGSVANVVSGKKRQVAIALYAGDKIMSFSRNTFDETELRDAMLANMKLIHLAPKNKERRLLETAKVHKGASPDLDLFDQNPPTREALIAYAKDVETAALAQKGVKTTRSVNVSRTISHSFTLATNGLDHVNSATYYGAGVGVIAEDASGMQIGGDSSSASHFSDMAAAAEVGKKAGKEAVAKLGATLPDTAVMPVVLDNYAAKQFFAIIYQALDGGVIYNGSSFFKDQIGQQVMGKDITLVDDPAVVRGLGSGQVDAAGLKMDKITFIENGVLKSYNATVREARLLGVEPSGRDGCEGGITNGMIMPGTKTPEELIADIKEGVYIKGFSGGSVSVNNGTHSRQASGVLIKDGKITDIAVDGFVVSGNLKDMFMNAAVANDTPAQPNTRHSLAAPTTRIDGVTIAGRKI